jgi:hypothetical protein
MNYRRNVNFGRPPIGGEHRVMKAKPLDLMPSSLVTNEGLRCIEIGKPKIQWSQN